MDESSKRIKRLLQEVMSEARDAVRVEDLDAGRPVTIGMSYGYGAVTLRFADSYTLHLSPEDAMEVANTIQNIAMAGKRER